jgi:hypothetical protein
MSAHMEDSAAKVELLLQAAETQQALAGTALDRLREYTSCLDATVRDEIRATLIEELRALREDARRAERTLRALARAANLRLLLWSVTSAGLAAAVPFALAWRLIPTPEEVVSLRSARDALRAEVEQLAQQGGHMQLSHCGSNRRLCARVDRRAGTYGAAGDFLVLEGY